MLLLSSSADSPLGLQTLISADADASSNSKGAGNVATRTIAASPSAVRRLAAANGREADGGREGKEEKGQPQEDRGGCWVSYGWRRLPRLLPPAIQSPRPLVRERTADGRLVISREEPAAHHVCARKVKDRRLVLELVDERNCGAAPPPQRRRRWSHPLVGQEANASASAAAGEEESAAAPTTTSPVAAAVAVPVPPVPAEACFKGAIREASLRETRMSLLRMVH